ncbi:hypothetical protein LG314_10535 [Agrococcus terreus]|uniref:hypothetical protein n=1 Tax=Agrococcus terreus TaxID=574649 RepID=UPI00384AAC44
MRLASTELERLNTDGAAPREPEHRADVAESAWSPIRLPVGFARGPMVVGRDGTLLLAEGSNGLRGQYEGRFAEPGATVDGLADRWRQLLEGRAARADRSGVELRQLIIPEKLSVLRALAPFDLAGPTPLLSAVEAHLEARRWYVPTTRLLEQLSPDDAFIPTDTHLAPRGAQAVAVASLAGSDAEDALAAVPMGRWDAMRGDLAAHLSPHPFGSLVRAPRSEAVEAFSSGLRVIERHIPAAHHERRYEFENETALTDRTALVFGNSFANAGDHAGHLTWWWARAFRRTVVRWSSDVDWDLVDQVRPHVVIAQTVERFLPRVAAA